jgi:tripartite-type tricarboxylate transporter receptor subunit TctC
MIVRVLLASLVLSSSVAAEEFPTRPVTVLEPLAAGGGVDVMMRVYADAASCELGQRIIIENKTGSGGIVAATAVKNTAADGYTLLHANSGTQAILPAMQSVPYDPINDFQPVTNLFTFSPYLVVPSSLPVRTALELAELARKTPGGLRFATPGTGSSVHLLGAMWNKTANVPFQHIPYRGNALVVNDLITGRVDFTFGGLVAVRPYVDSGQLRLIAIAGNKRELPGVPTMAEAGFPDIHDDTWFGIAAPASTPSPVLDKLNAAFARAASDAAVRERAESVGYKVTPSSRAKFRDVWLADRTRWKEIVKAVGLEVN